MKKGKEYQIEVTGQNPVIGTFVGVNKRDGSKVFRINESHPFYEYQPHEFIKPKFINCVGFHPEFNKFTRIKQGKYIGVQWEDGDRCYVTKVGYNNFIFIDPFDNDITNNLSFESIKEIEECHPNKLHYFQTQDELKAWFLG